MITDEIEIEEYKSLLDDTRMHMKLIPEILAFMVVSTTALLGYGINNKNAFVCLAPLLVIYACASLIQSQMEEVLRKGAYILCQYEQKKLWQNTLYKFRQLREKCGHRLFKKAAGDSRAIVVIIDFLVVLCFLCFIFYLPSTLSGDLTLKMILAAFLAIAILITLTHVFPHSPIKGILHAYTFENEEKYIKMFFSNCEKQLKTKEKNNGAERDKEKKDLVENEFSLIPKEWLFFLSSETTQSASKISRYYVNLAIIIAVLSVVLSVVSYIVDKAKDKANIADGYLYLVLICLLIIVALLIFLTVYVTVHMIKEENAKKFRDKIKEEIFDGTLTDHKEIYERWKRCKKS